MLHCNVAVTCRNLNFHSAISFWKPHQDFTFPVSIKLRPLLHGNPTSVSEWMFYFLDLFADDGSPPKDRVFMTQKSGLVFPRHRRSRPFQQSDWFWKVAALARLAPTKASGKALTKCVEVWKALPCPAVARWPVLKFLFFINAPSNLFHKCYYYHNLWHN